MTDLYYPLRSLREGHWFKLICGASFQHLPAIRSLVLAYVLAGADCIDVAADPAVVSTARVSIKLAAELAASNEGRSPAHGSPWLMVSFNDGEDPHFRKAEFDATACPPGCTRPCEQVCPAQAIVFQTSTSVSVSGVVSDRCYGCGRCLPVCPVQQISARSYVSTPAAIAPVVLQAGVDAIEIHTQIGHLDDFQRLWQAIAPWICNLKLVAISCPDGDGLFDYLWTLYDIISPLPCPLIWQMDGRPMSGDIGIGATRAAVKLGQKVLAAGLPGYIQLAGGTNKQTVPKLKALGLLHPHLLNPSALSPAAPSIRPEASLSYIAGIAYGSYARALLTPVLNQLDAIALLTEELEHPASTAKPDRLPLRSMSQCLSTASEVKQTGRSQSVQLEDTPALLWEAVALARSLVSQLKIPHSSQLRHLNL